LRGSFILYWPHQGPTAAASSGLAPLLGTAAVVPAMPLATPAVPRVTAARARLGGTRRADKLASVAREEENGHTSTPASGPHAAASVGREGVVLGSPC
jgi:hypothetical protein